VVYCGPIGRAAGRAANLENVVVGIVGLILFPAKAWFEAVPARISADANMAAKRPRERLLPE
jgi:hypothetical protein